jgi:hypothetical protein
MSTTTRTHEELARVVEEATAGRDDVGAHVTPYGPDAGPCRAVVEVTRMSHDTCEGCGQPLTVLAPGPVDWIDARTGRSQGGWSHQHGCGAWNAPMAVAGDIDLDGLDEAQIAGRVRTLVADLDDAVETDVVAREARARDTLRDTLREARARLDAPLTADEQAQDRLDEVCTGLAAEEGLDLDPVTGRLIAWTHAVLPDRDGPCVHEDDL